jgi:DNA polymerase-1
MKPEDLSYDHALWAYNGLDCCITHEVLTALLPQLNETTASTYRFSRRLQGPILEMNTRGLLVDQERREEVETAYRMKEIGLQENLALLVREGFGLDWEPESWRSPKKLGEFFYDVIGLPVQWRVTEGRRTRSVNRDALEVLKQYMLAEPVVNHIFALRDLGKKRSFLNTGMDRDGRIRTSFNIAGTVTGRLASSYSDYGTGNNLQNVENLLRSVFIADPGYKFCNIDLEQGDSRAVGAIHWQLFRDASFLDACESGDLHTSVARAAFPRLPWTGMAREDRAIANGPFNRSFSYRDAAKRLGHGSNYQGQPDKMARATRIPKSDIEEFQANYFKQFPAFREWWRWVGEQLRATRKITTLLGRQRHFLGDPKDAETIRGAIAYEPQSITADTIDRGLLALWRENRVQILLQVHDSILFQYREDEEDEVVPWALSVVEQTIALKGGREFTIPGEAKVGWNWSDTASDPDAMRKFTDPSRPRERSRFPHNPFR